MDKSSDVFWLAPNISRIVSKLYGKIPHNSRKNRQCCKKIVVEWYIFIWWWAVRSSRDMRNTRQNKAKHSASTWFILHFNGIICVTRKMLSNRQIWNLCDWRFVDYFDVWNILARLGYLLKLPQINPDIEWLPINARIFGHFPCSTAVYQITTKANVIALYTDFNTFFRPIVSMGRSVFLLCQAFWLYEANTKMIKWAAYTSVLFI